MTRQDRHTTVGILHCGDMGSAVAGRLLERGIRVVTTCHGRSHETAERARSAGVELLPDLDGVVRRSDVVISLVLPSAAVHVASEYAEGVRRTPDGKRRIFVEANSIGPEALHEIESSLTRQGILLVDACIHGGARHLADLGIMYLSGAAAGEVAELCRPAFEVKCLGQRIGSATTLKLLLAGVSKTVAALFLEAGVLAERADMLECFLESCRHFYPGILSAVERTLPTYPRHAGRRAHELDSIAKFAESAGSPAFMTRGAGELVRWLASLDWQGLNPDPSPGVQAIIRAVAQSTDAPDRRSTE